MLLPDLPITHKRALATPAATASTLQHIINKRANITPSWVNHSSYETRPPPTQFRAGPRLTATFSESRFTAIARRNHSLKLGSWPLPHKNPDLSEYSRCGGLNARSVVPRRSLLTASALPTRPDRTVRSMRIHTNTGHKPLS